MKLNNIKKEENSNYNNVDEMKDNHYIRKSLKGNDEINNNNNSSYILDKDDTKGDLFDLFIKYI